jgi:hypothetical protein
VTNSKNIAAEWSVAYAVSIKRLDSQFMLCLLRLMSWPNLGNMHGDLVDDLRLICALLAKRPMVGFLIARRLKLPVDKTFALLSVLESRGHITAVGANLMDVDLDALESVKTLNAKANTTPIAAKLTAVDKPSVPVASAPSALSNKPLQVVVEAVKPASITAKVETATKPTVKPTVEATQNSGDVLNQLWRVLNTDIVMSKAARDKMDPKAPVGKEAGDVLSQLWQVLNADIRATPESIYKSATSVPAKLSAVAKVTTLGNSDKPADKDKVKVLKDINGKSIVAEKSVEDEAQDVMSQLWSVLNTDISLKRQSGAEDGAKPSAAKTKEVAEVMSQLWRVLNTEIAAKRQVATKGGTESLSDTTREANDKLSKLWRILDTEITLKKKPKTYVMTNSPAGLVKKEVLDTSGEAVDRLSQLWQVLNSEITISMPPERRVPVAKRR